jgi:hypothetical protein
MLEKAFKRDAPALVKLLWNRQEFLDASDNHEQATGLTSYF